MPAYYDEKTKTWYCKFYYTDYTGTRKQKKKRGFKLQREAKEWERVFLSSLRYDDKTTFGVIARQYIEENKPRRRYNTIKTYTTTLKHILPTFENIPIGSIEEQTIIRWQNDLLQKGFSDIYTNKIDAVFRTIYKFGAKRCKITFNPFEDIKKIGKANSKSLLFWTYEQYCAFIPYVTNPVAKMAFEVIYYCGLRIGELFALTAADIDLNNRIIHITKSLQRVKKEDIITPPKSEKGIRDITIPNFLAKELANYMSRLYDCKGETRLFEISKQALYYPMKKYSQDAGVPKIRIHDLRHSHVALLIEKGVSPLAIADRLGHEDVQVTLGTYGHLYPNKQREIADILEAMTK